MNRALVIFQCGVLALLSACGSETSTPPAKTAQAPAANGLAVTAPSPAPAAEATPPWPVYEASLAEGIQFQKVGYPRFVKSVTGISGGEAFGRWSDAGTVVFTFAQPLPKKFVLTVETAAAYGANAGKPLRVKAGDWSGQSNVGAAPQAAEYRVDSTVPVSTIEFTIAEPASPRQLGKGDDSRMLGVAFKRLAITTP